jgi:hypothetical protein
MLNEQGEEVPAEKVPELVESLQQLLEMHETCTPQEQCHRCRDLTLTVLILQVLDKLTMLYHDAHHCLDKTTCKPCHMVEAYGLDMGSPEEESRIVSIN